MTNNELSEFITSINGDYGDDYGYSQVWNDEHAKWIETIYKICPEYINKNKKAVNNKKKRHEIFGEIMSIYWVFQNGGTNFTFPELENKAKFPLDFIFTDEAGKTWNVEVKSPSYEAELSEDLKNGSITQEQFTNRKKLPQYINGESRSVGFITFKSPIENSLRKFEVTPSGNNLVILCPNMFADMLIFGRLEGFYSFKKIVKETDIKGLISSVVFLQPQLPSGTDDVKFVKEVVNFRDDNPRLKTVE